MKTENEIYLEKEAKRVLKTQVENTLFSAYLTGKDYDRTGRNFDSWNTDNKVSETLIELILNSQFKNSPEIVLPSEEKCETWIDEKCMILRNSLMDDKIQAGSDQDENGYYITVTKLFEFIKFCQGKQ